MAPLDVKGMSSKPENIDDWTQDIINQCVQKGLLVNLLYTDEGKQLLSGYPEKKIKKMVMRALKKYAKEPKGE